MRWLHWRNGEQAEASAAATAVLHDAPSWSADPSGSDDELALHIRAEGAVRMAEGNRLSLERYLTTIPGIERRLLVLDAAIDVVLDSMSGDMNAVDALVESHPSFELQIRECAALTHALWDSGQPAADGVQFKRDLPCDFGPRLAGGGARYQLRAELGRGTHGVVYLAHDRLLSDDRHEAVVALKLLSSASGAVRDRKRLVEEAAKARRVDHPNIVKVLDRGVTADDEDYVVYELVAGGPIDLLFQSPLGAERTKLAAKLVAQVARGVQAAHSAGLVHCDLKPANILTTPDHVPKVTDFGVATRIDGPANRATGYWKGNLAFMSPEQMRGEAGANSVPADVYALGGLLVYLATGNLPRASEAATEWGKARPEIWPQEARSKQTLRMICDRALAKDPTLRHSSAAELARDLDAWLEKRPIPWDNASAANRLWLWTRRRPVVAAALVCLALSVLLGGFALKGLGYVWRKEEKYALADQAYRAMRTKLDNTAWKNNGLMILWAMESIFGDTILGKAESDEFLFNERIETVKYFLETARNEGREDDVDSLMWETCLALWLVSDQKPHPEVDELLEHNRSRWLMKTSTDDRVVQTVDMLRVANRVKRLYWAAAERELSSADRQILLEAVAYLDDYIQHLPLTARVTPFETLPARALRGAYSKSLLNDGDKAAYWDAVAKEEPPPARR